MESILLQKFGNKIITKQDLFRKVEQNNALLPELFKGTSSSKATIRYGCAKVLVEFSEKHPEKLYPYLNQIVELLESKHRILIWNGLAIIANLAKVDREKKIDALFDKFYGFLKADYMVTVANVVGYSAKIALAKPDLAQKITAGLLKVGSLKTTPHLTEECKRVIVQHAIETFDAYYGSIQDKASVITFVKRQLGSSRASLNKAAERFLKKWT